MQKKFISTILLVFAMTLFAQAKPTRTERLLEKGWKFTRVDDSKASEVGFDDGDWQCVTVPHDWAIYGPFDSQNDAQVVAITQNFERSASLKTGRTGGLPYVGTGWYRVHFDVSDFNLSKNVTLLFDGAMSNAEVYVNGSKAGEWAYGYNSFYLDVTRLVNSDGRDNVLAVRLENLPESSRWYSGAGLYRNVHLIVADGVHIPVWGTQVTTSEVSEESAKVCLKVSVEGATGIATEIIDSKGHGVASSKSARKTADGFEQNFVVDSPELWSPETPELYHAVTKVFVGGKVVDEYTTRFGIRTIELIPEEGFFLNGKKRKFQGVCNHHDLGPLGSAVNVAAIRRRLTLLKEMGCDAIRTSHNMPAPELVELCDRMGLMMIVEPFDEWDIAKCRNGYHLYFNRWAERDVVNMVRHYRNNPSVVMWSIGNEVPSQCDDSGYETAKKLIDIIHREDSTRFVTCGMDQVFCVLRNGLASLLDVPGFNYRVHLYQQAYDTLSHKLVLGSETASTLSSRGVYKFPVRMTKEGVYDDGQCSSYDLEYAPWSNLPDDDFAMADDHDWAIGQFVWTGFDYLGEPTPYNLMPNHSSMFGIIDLASIPKDRYYLYRSVWRSDAETLHILPHWTWPGREGKPTPVFVYTNYPSVELFVNGKSYGRRTKNNETKQTRYRLMWNEVEYEPGEVKAVAYDAAENRVAESRVATAGEPDHLELVADRKTIDADGKDLAYVEVKMVDRNGNVCPADTRTVRFDVIGAGSFRAAANGDATSLDLFHLPQMPLFGGRLTAIVQSSESSGRLTLTATADGVGSGTVTISVE